MQDSLFPVTIGIMISDYPAPDWSGIRFGRNYPEIIPDLGERHFRLIQRSAETNLHMQPPLKNLISMLHAEYFKINGFKKKQAHFSRVVDGVTQEVDFQSSQWNSKGEPIVFYVNLRISFEDIPLKNGSQISGFGRIDGLVSGAPAQFELTEQNEKVIYADLISYLPKALQALPSHYEDVRIRALRGFSTPIPLPATWRTETQMPNHVMDPTR